MAVVSAVDKKSPDKTVSVENWLNFLQERDDAGGILYKKNIRSVEDAKDYVLKNIGSVNTGPNKYLIFPKVNDIKKFYVYIYNGDKGNIFGLEFDDNKIYKLDENGSRDEGFIQQGVEYFKTYDIDDIKEYINGESFGIKRVERVRRSSSINSTRSIGGGGRRRRSRKAKKNKAHTPE